MRKQYLRVGIALRRTILSIFMGRSGRLSKSGELLRAIFNATADGILVVDREGNVTQANRQFAEMWHIPPEILSAEDNKKLIGFILDQVKTPGWFLSRIKMIHQSSLEGMEEIRLKDGRIFELSSCPLVREGSEVGRVWDFRDITERKHAEEMLYDQLYFSQQLLDAVPIPVFYKDVQEKYLGCNAAFTSFLGLSKEQIMGKTTEEVFPRDLADIYHESDMALFSRPGHQTYEASVLHANGSNRDVIFNKATYKDSAGHVAGLVGGFLDITERKQAEVALKQSRAQLQAVLDASLDSITLTNEQGLFLACNKALMERWGKSREQLLGHSASEVLPREIFLNRLERVKRTLSTGESDHFIDEHQGRWFENTIAPIADANGGIRTVALFSRDITERKHAEKALQESERKYRELVENANSIILRWNRGGEITYMNEFGQKFFGYTDSEIIGRHVVGTIVPETESTGRDLRPLMEEIIQDPVRFERNINENMLRSGDHVWIDWTNKVVLNEQGELIEILSIGSDITKRKRAEEELQKAHDELERRIRERTSELLAANERLQELDRLKSEFLATMSHELRTPLNSIIGFTGILKQGIAGPVNDEQKKQLDMAYNSAKHLLSLINDLLDLSRIEAGKVELEHESFNFADVVTEVVEGLKPMANQKGISILTDLPGNEIGITGDRKRCFQVLLNLVNNAVKFTEQGEIRIMGRVEGKTLKVCVADTGIGIKPEYIPMLFEAFRQVDGSAKRIYEGTGLGLYLCRTLLKMMGGDIVVESEFEKGSRFTFTIPLMINEV